LPACAWADKKPPAQIFKVGPVYKVNLKLKLKIGLPDKAVTKILKSVNIYTDFTFILQPEEKVFQQSRITLHKMYGENRIILLITSGWMKSL